MRHPKMHKNRLIKTATDDHDLVLGEVAAEWVVALFQGEE